MLDQYDRLRKRNAFLDQYKKEPIFQNDLSEFDESRYLNFPLSQLCKFPSNVVLYRATVDELLREYKACGSPDYISYGTTMDEETH